MNLVSGGQAFANLEAASETNLLFVGDMNWNPDDRKPPLPPGWYANHQQPALASCAV